MKKSYVYEYETTRKRKFWNGVEYFVNSALLFTFSAIILIGVGLAFVHLIMLGL